MGQQPQPQQLPQPFPYEEVRLPSARDIRNKLMAIAPHAGDEIFRLRLSQALGRMVVTNPGELHRIASIINEEIGYLVPGSDEEVAAREAVPSLLRQALNLTKPQANKAIQNWYELNG